MRQTVSSSSLDSEAIQKRGGGTDRAGAHWFGLFGCPDCAQIHLAEYTYSVRMGPDGEYLGSDLSWMRVYTNPEDLRRGQVLLQEPTARVHCAGCCRAWSAEQIEAGLEGVGQEADPWQVSWSMLKSSAWEWIAPRIPTCPECRARRVEFGGVISEEFAALISYCPVCETGYLSLQSENIRAGQPLMLSARKDTRGTYVLRSSDSQVPDAVLQEWQAALEKEIPTFLAERQDRWQYCCDDVVIPLLAELPFDAKRTIKVAWCQWCDRGNVYLCDWHYGAEPIGAVRRTGDPPTYAAEIIYEEFCWIAGAPIAAVEDVLNLLNQPGTVTAEME